MISTVGHSGKGRTLETRRISGLGGCGVEGRGGDPCGWGSLPPPSDCPQVWASASSWGAPPSALTDPSELTHKTIKALFFFCPVAKDIEVSGKQKCKIATVTLQPRDTYYLGLRRYTCVDVHVYIGSGIRMSHNNG